MLERAGQFQPEVVQLFAPQRQLCGGVGVVFGTDSSAATIPATHAGPV